MGPYRILIALAISAGVAQAAIKIDLRCPFSRFGCSTGWCEDVNQKKEDCTCSACTCADKCLTGSDCKTVKDTAECDPCRISNPPLCPNNRTVCVSTTGSAQCVCAHAFTGYNCEFAVGDSCETYPCLNGGTCRVEGASYKCACTDDYTGEQCHRVKDVNPCEDLAQLQSCGAHGSPVAVLDNTRCVCACSPEWQGVYCEQSTQLRKCNSECGDCFSADDDVFVNMTVIESNEMSISMCRQMLTESPGKEEYWIVAGTKCILAESDLGMKRTNIKMCQTKCKGNGTEFCGDEKNAVLCRCPLTIDDTKCEKDSCGEGYCVEGQNGYSCVCAPGRTGQNCQDTIDPCVTFGCEGASTCIPTVDMAAARCICPRGRSGPKCEKLDACSTVPCLNSGTCLKAYTAAGYDCRCLKAFYGADCENFSACVSSPCVNGGTCYDVSDAVYNCSCVDGWKGRDCEQKDVVYRILQKIGGGTISNKADMEILLEDLLANPSKTKDVLPYLIGLLPPENRTALSWDVEDMFLWITYEEKSLDLKKDLVVWNDVVLGNCFTFNHFNNSDRLYRQRADGPQGGLKAALKLNSDEYAPWVETTAIMTFIHPIGETIFSESARYNSRPSTMVTIQSSEVLYKRLGGRYGKCVRSVKDVPSYYYEGNYTTYGCFHSCYQDEMKKACGCMDSRYPMPEGETACELNNRTCVESIVARGDVAMWADCTCPLPCLNSHFDSSYTVAPFVRGPRKCNIYTKAQRNKTVCDDVNAQPDHVIVNVQVPRLIMTLYEETPVWTFNRVIGTIGGLGGIVCGINIITVFEFGFFFFVQLPMTFFFNRQF